MHIHHLEQSDPLLDETDKAICPVMHIPVSQQGAIAKDLVRKYEGKTYYLCCKTCENMFDNNPEQYGREA